MKTLRRPRIALVLLLTGAAGQLARAQDPAARVPYKSSDEKVSVTLPASWKTKSAKIEDYTHIAMWCDIATDKKKHHVYISVQLLPTGLSPQVQAHLEADHTRRERKHAETASDPLPHTIFRTTSRGKEEVLVNVFRSLKGRIVTTQLSATADAWPALRDEVMKIAQSVQVNYEHYPPAPQDIPRSEKGGFVWYRAKGVSSSQYAVIQKIAKKVRKQFEKVHGKSKPTPNERVTVLVAKDLSIAKRIHPNAATSGWTSTPALHWVVVRPLQNKNAQARFASTLMSALSHERYRANGLHWAANSECELALFPIYCGKTLPFVPQSVKEATPFSLRDLSEIWAWERDGMSGDGASNVYWTAFFHAGPPRYRKAYVACWREYAATGDADAAMKKHIFAFDDHTLKVAATKWLKKLKGVE